MTMRHTLTVNLEDIKTVEFRCKCGGVASIPPTEHLRAHIACPSCGQIILEADLTNGRNIGVHQVMAGLAKWTDKTDKTCQVTFTLEVNGEDEQQSETKTKG